MRVIKLEVSELGQILESKTYLNKKGEERKILTNVEYFLQSKGIKFSCRLYVDTSGELGITEINGKKPKGYECHYCLEWIFPNEVKNLFLSLMEDHGFVPSYRPIEEYFIGGCPTIEYKGKKYSEIAITKTDIFLINLSKNGDKLLDKIGFMDEHFYDIVKKIKKADIEFSDFSIWDNTGVAMIKTKEGLLKIGFENIYYNWVARNFRKLKRSIK